MPLSALSGDTDSIQQAKSLVLKMDVRRQLSRLAYLNRRSLIAPAKYS
jgi:hypothetical protein